MKKQTKKTAGKKKAAKKKNHARGGKCKFFNSAIGYEHTGTNIVWCRDFYKK